MIVLHLIPCSLQNIDESVPVCLVLKLCPTCLVETNARAGKCGTTQVYKGYKTKGNKRGLMESRPPLDKRTYKLRTKGLHEAKLQLSSRETQLGTLLNLQQAVTGSWPRTVLLLLVSP